MGVQETNEPYRRNHYVPKWYQHRFLLPDVAEKKFFYLDKSPGYVVKGTRRIRRADVLRWGPARCFYEDDLYTTKFGGLESTEIEQLFFGAADNDAPNAFDFLSDFEIRDGAHDAFHVFLPYMSLQKMRTPKGLAALSATLRVPERNRLLLEMQRLHRMFCAIWTESIWSIVDASESTTKFIISDHPVTMYNKACFPGSVVCAGANDPDIRHSGTHTIYPLSLDRCLVLTNLSWVRNPYGNPTAIRPNPALFRDAMFNMTQVQVRRKLTEQEVIQINHIIKTRAYKYVAAAKREWLFPEQQIGNVRWDQFGGGLLLMPDPRNVAFSREIIAGYDDGRPAQAWDEYGRRPGQAGFRSNDNHDLEWNSFQAFRCEFARRFGRRRRGVSFEFGRVQTEDSEEYHRGEVSREAYYKAKMKAAPRGAGPSVPRRRPPRA